MNTDIDRTSFADSDQFDEDSVNSWISDSEDQVNNWRGWKKVLYSISNSDNNRNGIDNSLNQPEKLIKQAAKIVAAIQPGFDLTERCGVPFPEELIKLIAYFSFPSKDEEIRLYSCLGCGNIDEYIRGENLYKGKAVKECLQIGFHLSAKVLRRLTPQDLANYNTSNNNNNNNNNNVASVLYEQGNNYITFPAITTRNDTKPYSNISNPVICKVGITFDRGRITSCNCSCYQEFVDPAWCSHIVAACLYRIHEAHTIKIRAPISESLSKLTKEDLQKFSQFLISKMNSADILPAAQNILDELLASTNNSLKSIRGAPDLTAGASSEDQPNWYFDQIYIQDNISKILQKFCVPKPVVYGDPRHLSNNLPQVAQEYQNILRPMRGKEPEGIWNLINIIRDMFRREDTNALSLLRILTKCLLDSKPIIMWWYCIKLNQDSYLKTGNSTTAATTTTSGGTGHHNYGPTTSAGGPTTSATGGGGGSSSSLVSQYASSYFCDEMVELWRLAALKCCLPCCHFVSSRRLQSQHVYTTSSTTTTQIQELQALTLELAKLHRQVIKIAIHNLDRQQPTSNNNSGSTIFSYNTRSYNNRQNNNNSTSNSQLQLQQQQLLEAHQKSMFNALFSKDAQRAFMGFKPALNACRLSMAMLMKSKNNSDNHHHKISSNLIINQSNSLTNQKFEEPSNSDAEADISNIDELEDIDEVEEVEYDPQQQSPTSQHNDHHENAEVGLGNTNNNPANIPILPVSHFVEEYNSSEHHMKYFIHTNLKFGQCEALFFNGYFNESAQLAYDLADELLDQQNQLFDIMYNEARCCLIESHQKLNSNSSGCNLAGAANASVLPSGSFIGKGSRKHRVNQSNCTGSNYTNIWQQSPMSNGSGGGSAVLCDFDQIYQAKLVLRRVQFLFNCLVSDCVDFNGISPAQRLFMPSKSKLMEQALHLLLFGLQLPRPPAPLRQLEVSMIQLEIDLIGQAQQIKWTQYISNYRQQLAALATQLRDKSLPYLTEIHVPYNLTSFVFDQLNWSNALLAGSESSRYYNQLAFEAALSVLSIKTKITENIDALLVEGQRRLRDELSAYLLNVYKDDHDRLTLILKQLLNLQLNPHFKAAPLNFYLTNSIQKMFEPYDESPAQQQQPLATQQSSTTVSTTNPIIRNFPTTCVPQQMQYFQPQQQSNYNNIPTSHNNNSNNEDNNKNLATPSVTTVVDNSNNVVVSSKYLAASKSRCTESNNHKTNSSLDTDSSALEDDNSETSINERKPWDQKVRCLAPTKKTAVSSGSGGGSTVRSSAIDSSAPETTESSDNSPTTIRKRIFTSGTTGQLLSATTVLYNVTCNGEPCGADKIPQEHHKDSMESSGDHLSNSNTALQTQTQPASGPINHTADESLDESPACQMLTPPKKPLIFAADHLNDVQEAVTESLAHHMFELAQTVLQKAGLPDDSCTPVFRVTASINYGSSGLPNNGSASTVNGATQSAASSSHISQRNLQLCAFQLGLYALGLYNQLNALWQSRTYSSHVAWISTQVVEASGPGPACVLWHTWRHHLTPSEVAETAFRVSQRRPLAAGGESLHVAGAELCLAVLREGCSALNPSQIERGLKQCSEQSPAMLERALLAVERGADLSLSGVQPVIYFQLAQAWYDLYKSVQPLVTSSAPSITNNTAQTNNSNNNTANPMNNPLNYSYPTVVPGPSTQQMFTTPPFYHQTQFQSTNNMMPQIPQLMGNHIIISQRQAAAGGPSIATSHMYPGAHYMPPFATAHTQTIFNPVLIYNNIIPGPPSSNNTRPYTALQCFHPPGSLSNAPIVSPVGQVVLQHHQQQQQHRPAPQQISHNNSNANNEYLVRAFNTAMRAIHILFQLNTAQSTSNTNDHNTIVNNNNPSHNTTTTTTSNFNNNNNNSGNCGTGSGARRHHYYHHKQHNNFLITTSTTCSSQLDDSAVCASGVSSSDCLSHDNNIKFTLKLARLLGPEEVNRYCIALLQFVQNPNLMKDVVNNVMEYWQLNLSNFDPNQLLMQSSQQLNTNQPPPSLQQQQQQQQYLSYSNNSNNNPTLNQYYPNNNNRLPTTLYNPPINSLPNPNISNLGAVHHPIVVLQSPQQNSSSISSSNNSSTNSLQQLINNNINQQQTPTSNSQLSQPSSSIPPVSLSSSSASSAATTSTIVSSTSNIPIFNNSHNTNTSMLVNYPLQNGIELIQKMINRLHYLFRRVIEKRLQQTGQGSRDWDNLVELILAAYRAQRELPASDPNLSWFEILQKIKTHRKCSKDLWARICTGLQTADQH